MAEVPIADPEIPEAAAEAAVNVIRSGDLRQGEQVGAFEDEFADRVGAEHAVAVSSGTAALHIAYLALINPGEDVLVPALSHISTASMVHFAGGNPVICDVDRTGTLDADDARSRVTADAAAIAPVHLYGGPADMHAIMQLSVDEGLLIIADAAQAHGTTYSHQDVSNYGNITTYSFYPTKHVTTGEGGMIVTDDAPTATKARYLRSHWQTEKYYHDFLGLNYRLTDIGAAIGREHLKTLDDRLDTRRHNAQFLADHLPDGLEPTDSHEPAGHTYHQFTVRATDRDRDAVIDALADHGIETAIHYPRPLHHQPAINRDVSLPTAEQLCEEVVSLPVHEALSEDDLDRVAAALAAI